MSVQSSQQPGLSPRLPSPQFDPSLNISWTLVIAAGLAKFIGGAFALSFSPLLPDVTRSLGTDAATVGLAGGAYGLMSGLLALLGAPIQDRSPRLRLTLIGIGLHILGLLCSALAWSWQLFVLGNGLCGAAIGIMLPALVAHLADHCPSSRRAQLLGRTNIGWGLSTLIGVPISTLVGSSFGWRASPLLLVLLWAVVAALLLAGPKFESDIRSDRKDEAAELETGRWNNIAWRLVASTFFGFVGFYGVYGYVGSAARVEGQSATSMGMLVGFYGFGFLVGTRLGRAIDRLGCEASLVLSLAYLAVVLSVIPLVTELSWHFAAMFFAFWGVGQAAFFTSSTALITMLGNARRGSMLACNQAALSAGLGVGTAAMGHVYSSYGFQSVGLICAFATALAAMLAYSSYFGQSRDPQFTRL